METDDVENTAVLNALCLNKLTMNMMKRIEADIELKRKIALNDAAVSSSAKKMDRLIDGIYRLIEKENYKRALLLLCMLSRELKFG